MTARAPMASPFARERDFQSTVCQLAKTLGCVVYHTHDSRRSEPGFQTSSSSAATASSSAS